MISLFQDNTKYDKSDLNLIIKYYDDFLNADILKMDKKIQYALAILHGSYAKYEMNHQFEDYRVKNKLIQKKIRKVSTPVSPEYNIYEKLYIMSNLIYNSEEKLHEYLSNKSISETIFGLIQWIHIEELELFNKNIHKPLYFKQFLYLPEEVNIETTMLFHQDITDVDNIIRNNRMLISIREQNLVKKLDGFLSPDVSTIDFVKKFKKNKDLIFDENDIFIPENIKKLSKKKKINFNDEFIFI